MRAFRTKRRALAVSGIAVVVVLATAAVAIAVTSTVLADANTVNFGKFKSADGVIKLKTEGSVRVRTVQTSGAEPGFFADWHTHPGPVIVAMSPTSAGSLTIYDGHCNGTTIGAGQAYIETPNRPVFARNESGANADWITTMILPIGAPPATSIAAPCTP